MGIGGFCQGKKAGLKTKKKKRKKEERRRVMIEMFFSAEDY